MPTVMPLTVGNGFDDQPCPFPPLPSTAPCPAQALSWSLLWVSPCTLATGFQRRSPSHSCPLARMSLHSPQQQATLGWLLSPSPSNHMPNSWVQPIDRSLLGPRNENEGWEALFPVQEGPPYQHHDGFRWVAPSSPDRHKKGCSERQHDCPPVAGTVSGQAG